MTRQDINFKALHLTKLKINIGASARTGTVRKAWEKEDISTKWEQTTWAKKLAARKRVRHFFFIGVGKSKAVYIFVVFWLFASYLLKSLR